jgi:hypothetical protein
VSKSAQKKKPSCGDGWSTSNEDVQKNRVPEATTALPGQSTENGPAHHTRARDLEVFGADIQASGNLARSSMKAKSLTILRLRL